MTSGTCRRAVAHGLPLGSSARTGPPREKSTSLVLSSTSARFPSDQSLNDPFYVQLEGTNDIEPNQMTLHTSSNCAMPATRAMTGCVLTIRLKLFDPPLTAWPTTARPSATTATLPPTATRAAPSRPRSRTATASRSTPPGEDTTQWSARTRSSRSGSGRATTAPSLRTSRPRVPASTPITG